MSPAYRALHDRVAAIVEDASPRDAKLRAIARVLRDGVGHYDWVGFYLVDGASPNELVLGPFEGAPTEHTRIPFGRGVCGQVAESHETMVVQDIAAEANYLACSLDVRSEIVTPILQKGRFVAELDIDSHAVAPFGDDDRALLEAICERLSPLF